MLSSREQRASASRLAVDKLPTELVNDLSDRLGEPDWLRTRRLAAARIYEALPLPRWERGIRGWWTTNLSDLRLDHIRPLVADKRSVQVQHVSSADHAGAIYQRDSHVFDQWLDPSLAAKGVVFNDLSRAAIQFPEVVQAHLKDLTQETEDKFVALHAALWTGGVFVYVPAGVEVVLPLQAQFHLASPNAAMFAHTLLIAEAGSRVTYLEHYTSNKLSGQGLHSGVIEVYARDGADVQFVTLHNWSNNVFNFVLSRSYVERDARLRWVSGFLGSALTRASVETRLTKPGASLDSVGIFFGSGNQHLDLTSRTFHSATHTSGDVLYKGVVKDAARAALEGVIRVERGAQQTESYLSDHTLQLSRDAKSESVPSLEIEANDVRVSHGATVGMIDEEQLFYLMSRGLSRAKAERTIVRGFFDPALQRVPLAKVRRELLDSIERKMGAEHD